MSVRPRAPRAGAVGVSARGGGRARVPHYAAGTAADLVFSRAPSSEMDNAVMLLDGALFTPHPGSAKDIALNGAPFLDHLEWTQYMLICKSGIYYDGCLMPWTGAENWTVGRAEVRAGAPLTSGRFKSRVIDKVDVCPAPYPTRGKPDFPLFNRAEAAKLKEHGLQERWWETDTVFQIEAVNVVIRCIKEAASQSRDRVAVSESLFKTNNRPFLAHSPPFLLDWLKDNDYGYRFLAGDGPSYLFINV